MDWFNEIANALVLHFDGHAALWTVTGHTSFLILIGLTVEISLFFAINGIIFTKLLPADRGARILGLPNRWAIAIGLSLVSVGVELLLHADGVFHWHYWWWNVASFPVIVVFGYLTFYVVAFTVYDAPRRARQLQIVGFARRAGSRSPGWCSAPCSAGSERHPTAAPAFVRAAKPVGTRCSSCDEMTRSISPYSRACSAVK